MIFRSIFSTLFNRNIFQYFLFFFYKTKMNFNFFTFLLILSIISSKTFFLLLQKIAVKYLNNFSFPNSSKSSVQKMKTWPKSQPRLVATRSRSFFDASHRIGMWSRRGLAAFPPRVVSCSTVRPTRPNGTSPCSRITNTISSGTRTTLTWRRLITRTTTTLKSKLTSRMQDF